MAMCQGGQHCQLGRVAGWLLAQDDGDGLGPRHQRLEHELWVAQVNGPGAPLGDGRVRRHHEEHAGAVQACAQAGEVYRPALALVVVAGQLYLDDDGERVFLLPQADDQVRAVLGRKHLGELGGLHLGLGPCGELQAQRALQQLGRQRGPVVKQAHEAFMFQGSHCQAPYLARLTADAGDARLAPLSR